MLWSWTQVNVNLFIEVYVSSLATNIRLDPSPQLSEASGSSCSVGYCCCHALFPDLINVCLGICVFGV